MSVRIGIIDSGVNLFHSHVGGISGGVCLWRGADGRIEASDDFRDVLGHGTAVAGVIRWKAPDAELYAIKVFHRQLATTAEVITEAIRWALGKKLKLINLSLGSHNLEHTALFQHICDEALRQGSIVVAPARSQGQVVLPGSLACCLGVALIDPCEPDEYFYRQRSGQVEFLASRWPRDLPGVPRERNLNGLSFAVAHITGFAARIVREQPDTSLADIERQLIQAAREIPENQTSLHPSFQFDSDGPGHRL